MAAFLNKYFSKSAPTTPAPTSAAPDKLARLEAENARLKAELRRNGSILNHAQTPIWMRDSSLNITFCNVAFNEMAEEAMENAEDIASLELYRGHRALAARALESGREQSERRHVVVAGKRQLYLIREVPIKGEGVIGYATHISDLEAAEEEIERHVAALRDLLESSTSAMTIYGRDMKLKFYNFAFVNLWKMDESWLDTEPTYGDILEVMREKRKLPEQANFKAFKQAQLKLFTTLIEPQEEFFYLPDGRTLRVIAIPHALGGILFAYEDVTDRLALERSYNTLIAVQRETLDNLHEGVAVFAETGRLTLCNPIFRRLWKLSPEFTATEPHVRDVFGKCEAFFTTDDWPRYLEGLVARFTQRRMLTIRFERADHTVVDCSAVPLPDGAMLLSFVDVTDSTLVERSLRDRADALETADRMKTEFLANMSYELRSPLTSISGFAEMLAREYVGALNPAQQGYVAGIYQSSQHLADMIGDIIDMATIEAGYLKLEVAPFDLRQAVEGAVALMHERLALNSLSIEIAIAEGCTQLVADETRVKQILLNLLSNAAKVTKAKGSIIIRAEREAAGPLRLSVKDDGPGLDAERRARLFDPFFRGVSSKGTDSVLSLSLVKRFMELHGGEVIVNSAPGEGTEIICVFAG